MIKTYTEIQNASQWDSMLGVSGKKLIYIVSDRCDGRYTQVKVNGINADYTGYDDNSNISCYLVKFEDMYSILAPIFQSQQIPVIGLPAIMYYNGSSLQWIHGGTSPDTENIQKHPWELVKCSDIMAYDTISHKLVTLDGIHINYNNIPSRYITNGDVLLGVTGGKHHAVAPVYADGGTWGISDNTAAAPCHYRIEGPDGETLGARAGSLNFSFNIGNKSGSGSASWNAGATIGSIITQITSTLSGDYISVVTTRDQKAIGIQLGGYGVNTITFSSSSNCKLIDCTTLAVFDKDRTLKSGMLQAENPRVSNRINSSHKSWRGAASSTILNSYLTSAGLTSLTGTNSASYDLLGQNRQYRGVCNVGGAASWGGDATTFVSDGAGGSDVQGFTIMQQSVFNNNVKAGASGNALKMYNFYTALMKGTGEQKALHDYLIDRFGASVLTNLWRWYLACHAVDLDASSGITSSVRNKGVYETHVLGCIYTVDYNYEYYPAYPPEYNTVKYEEQTPIWVAMYDYEHNTNNKNKWDVQIYSTAEPFDLASMYADAWMARINSRLSDPWLGLSNKTNLSNSVYTGSFAQYRDNYCWYFNGNNRVMIRTRRCNSYFRPRPVAAY